MSYTVSVEKLWTQNTRIIHDVWRLLILSNEEKRTIMKILKKEWLWKFQKGGSREKGGGGNEIHVNILVVNPTTIRLRPRQLMLKYSVNNDLTLNWSSKMSNSSTASSICTTNSQILLVHFPIRITMWCMSSLGLFAILPWVGQCCIFYCCCCCCCSLYCTFFILVSTTELMTYTHVTKIHYTTQRLTSLFFTLMKIVSANCTCNLTYGNSYSKGTVVAVIVW